MFTLLWYQVANLAHHIVVIYFISFEIELHWRRVPVFPYFTCVSLQIQMVTIMFFCVFSLQWAKLLWKKYNNLMALWIHISWIDITLFTLLWQNGNVVCLASSCYRWKVMHLWIYVNFCLYDCVILLQSKYTFRTSFPYMLLYSIPQHKTQPYSMPLTSSNCYLRLRVIANVSVISVLLAITHVTTTTSINLSAYTMAEWDTKTFMTFLK